MTLYWEQMNTGIKLEDTNPLIPFSVLYSSEYSYIRECHNPLTLED